MEKNSLKRKLVMQNNRFSKLRKKESEKYLKKEEELLNVTEGQEIINEEIKSSIVYVKPNVENIAEVVSDKLNDCNNELEIGVDKVKKTNPSNLDKQIIVKDDNKYNSSEESDDEWNYLQADKNHENDLSFDKDSYSINDKKQKHLCSANICAQVQEKLRLWAINCIVFHTFLNALLKILHDILPCLPLCSKTLLRTTNKFVIEKFYPEIKNDKSEYAYFGLAYQLNRIVNPENHLNNRTLLLQFNIDGLPLFKSGGQEF